MLTIGYGDISPKTIIEKGFIIVVAVFACGVFGYALNTLGSIFQEISKNETDFK